MEDFAITFFKARGEMWLIFRQSLNDSALQIFKEQGAGSANGSAFSYFLPPQNKIGKSSLDLPTIYWLFTDRV
jgi:hypothetical protein